MLRPLAAAALAAGLLLAATPPARAEPSAALLRRLQPSVALLLRDPRVQDELKLSDDQKDALRKVADLYRDDIRKAFLDGDMKKARDLIQSAGADAEKVLKPDQLRRVRQIEIQAAGLLAFDRDDVQAALKLSDRQKKDIEDAEGALEKDAEGLFVDARGDPQKLTAAVKRLMVIRKEAVEKAVNGLSDEQKNSWKELTGEPFEFSPFTEK